MSRNYIACLKGGDNWENHPEIIVNFDRRLHYSKTSLIGVFSSITAEEMNWLRGYDCIKYFFPSFQLTTQ